MNWNRPAWWPSLRRGRLSREAGAALFQGLRVRLTLWYCLVLGAALVLFSVALYFSVQHFLLTPIEDAAAASAMYSNLLLNMLSIPPSSFSAGVETVSRSRT